jgi:hypothetical protein
MLELAEVVRRFEATYRRTVAFRVTPAQARALAAIRTCRTPVRGGQVWRCDAADCRQERYSYHSCRHRSCPKCQGDQTARWLERAAARLLPCPYWLLTVTVPSELRRVGRAHPKEVLDLLLRAAQTAVVELGWTHLGARVGLLAVLHTWTRALLWHPHVHLLVTGGGLARDDLTWRAAPRAEYLLPQQALANRVRTRMQQGLARLGLLGEVPAAAWGHDWIAHCQAAGAGTQVLAYLGRYVFRSPLPSSRITAITERTVTFTVRPRHAGALQPITLPGEHLVARIVQHVLPHRFIRVRWSGLLSPAAGTARARATAALAAAPPVVGRTPRLTPPREDEVPDPPLRPAVHPPPAASRPAHRCPVCGVGTLRLVGRLPPRRGPP